MSVGRARRFGAATAAAITGIGLAAAIPAAAAPQQPAIHPFWGTAGATAKAGPTAAAPLSRFQPYAPFRLFDTRPGPGPLRPGESRPLVFGASSGLPSDATALVLNLTTTDVTANTYITVWPTGAARPVVAAINVPPGSTRSNQVVVPLGKTADGTPAVSFYNNAGSTQVVGDLAGVYRGTSVGTNGYTPVAPQRVLDTRNTGPVGPNQEVTLDLSKAVPEGTASVTMNVTALTPIGSYLTVYPDGVIRPGVSSVNSDAGQTTPNLVTVQLPPDRRLRVYNHTGDVQVLADLEGYYTVDGAGSYQPVNPVRVVDTRAGGGPIGAGTSRSVPLAGHVAANATAATVNLTGILPTAPTYLTEFATGAAKPATSNLNVAPGQALSNLGNIPVSTGNNALSVYNNSGSTHVAVDLSGYFVPQNP